MFVRLALESDVPALVELTRADCQLSTPHLAFSEERVRETFQSYLDTADPTIFVVEEKREIIGFLVATINGYRQAEGLFINQETRFVRSDKRSTQAASLLVRHLIAWSEKLGALEIIGDGDTGKEPHSERTARFLEQFGFERVGYSMQRAMTNGR